MSPELEVLSSSPLMHGMGKEKLGSLLITGERRIYEPGNRIVEEGTPSDCLFILADGVVDVVKGDGDEAVLLNTLAERGDFFGEMSLIDSQPRVASARALSDTKGSVISRQSLQQRLDRLEENDRVLRRLIGVLVNRVRGQASSPE